MSTLSEMISRIQSINMEQQIAQAMEQTEDTMILFNQYQLMKGVDGDGNKLPAYRSRKYAKVKNEKNPLPGLGTPDYRLTGNLYSQMYIDFQGDSVKILSHADYFGEITARGGSPFSLNKESKKEYSEDYLIPVLVRNVANILGVPTT